MTSCSNKPIGGGNTHNKASCRTLTNLQHTTYTPSFYSPVFPVEIAAQDLGCHLSSPSHSPTRHEMVSSFQSCQKYWRRSNRLRTPQLNLAAASGEVSVLRLGSRARVRDFERPPQILVYATKTLFEQHQCPKSLEACNNSTQSKDCDVTRLRDTFTKPAPQFEVE